MAFQPGHTGRPKGTRNKLTSKFLEDLLADWQENGTAAIRICRIEDPVAYCKLVAGTLPRDLHIETTAVAELAEDELDRMIETLRERALTARQEEALDITPRPKVLLNGH
jgi:hypothetical protein